MIREFTEKEWNQIVEDAFSPDAPEPPFSERYRARRMAMEREFAMKKKHSVKKSVISILAIAAAAAVITPTAVIAGIRMYEARMEQTNTYQRTVEIDPGDEVSEEIMALHIGWLPEDIVYHEDGPYGGKYRSTDENADRGLTKMFYRIPDGVTLSEDITLVTAEEQFTTASGHQAFYAGSTDSDAWGQLWIAFEGTPYVAQLYVCGFSEEELLRIADNVTLIPSDEETAQEWHPQEYYNAGADKKDTRHQSMEAFSGSYANMRPFEIGETISYLDIDEEQIDIRVNSVTVQNDFDGLTTDGCGFDMDYSEFLDANGNITTVRQHVLIGDRVSTLDEVISEETVQQYVIKLNLTYTNTGDETLEYITIFDTLFWLDDDKMMNFYHDAEGLVVGHLTTEELMVESNAFSLYTDHETQKNNLYNVAPGESVDVECAYLVDEDWFGNLYLKFGSIATSNYAIASRPVLDLSDLRPE